MANRSFQDDKIAFFLHVKYVTKKNRNEKKSHLIYYNEEEIAFLDK